MEKEEKKLRGRPGFEARGSTCISFTLSLIPIPGTKVSIDAVHSHTHSGLLGAHFAAVALKKGHTQLSWYDGELLRMAEEVGQRLLPAFNTTTGLPYAKVRTPPTLSLGCTCMRSENQDGDIVLELTICILLYRSTII